MTFLHQKANLLLCMRLFLDARTVTQLPCRPVGNVIQYPDKRLEDTAEDHHWKGNRQQDALDILNRHGFWRKLPKDNMHRRDEREGNRQRNRMPKDRVKPRCICHRQNKLGHRWLAHPAESK